MSRILNEYLKNNYYGRYWVEKNVVLYALIVGDNILPIIIKQSKQAKKYFESLKSCSMNLKMNDKIILDQLENEKIKKKDRTITIWLLCYSYDFNNNYLFINIHLNK